MSTLSLDYYYGHESEQFIFYRIPKLLFTDDNFADLSIEAKVLYGVMLDRMGLSIKNQWLDEKKRVYIVFTIDKIMNLLHCREQKANKLLKDLEEIGLIERKRNGLGKPNFIYVKNFLGFYKKEENGTKKEQEETKNTEKIEDFSVKKVPNDAHLQQSQQQKSENDNSRNAIFTTQHFPESQSINTPLINNTDSSDTVFNKTKKNNQTVCIDNNKVSYPSYLSSIEQEQKTDKIDEIDTFVIDDTDTEKEKEKKEKEKPRQRFFLDKKLEEQLQQFRATDNTNTKSSFFIDKGQKEQIQEIVATDNTDTKPRQRFFIDEELKKQIQQQQAITADNTGTKLRQRFFIDTEQKEQTQEVAVADNTDTNSMQKFPLGKRYREQIYREKIKTNIGYESLVTNQHYIFDKGIINNIVDIMLSVIISERPYIWVNGEEMPHNMVKDRFLKLGQEHIDYMLQCLKKTTTKIKNIRAYYISTLYNSYETMDAYYTAEVNHDFHGFH